MKLSKEQFKNNMIGAINEAKINFNSSIAQFIITPVKEENVNYNTLDEYLKLWMFNEKNLKNRYFSLTEVIDFLVQPNQKFPIWIKISCRENLLSNQTFELQTSMRFRTPTQLKHIDSGFPPFIFEIKE